MATQALISPSSVASSTETNSMRKTFPISNQEGFLCLRATATPPVKVTSLSSSLYIKITGTLTHVGHINIVGSYSIVCIG